MNKIFSKFAIAIASFAMVIGGVSAFNNEQAKPLRADDGDIVTTFESESVVNYGYGEWEDEYSGWKVSWGGEYKCGFDFNAWKTFEEQGYTKYLGSTVAASRYGFVAATITPASYVGSADFYVGSASTGGSLYLMYSLDDETYTPITLSSGEQGCSISGGVTYSFDFSSTRRAYYALIVVNNQITPPSGRAFQYRNVISHFYEEIDPSIERITVSGPNTVYTERDIELTITTYNFNPTEFTVTSSDTSVATVSYSGNIVTVRGVDRGTAGITVSTMGTDGLVYIDPFTITVKKFEVVISGGLSISMGTNELRNIYYSYEDKEGPIFVAQVTSSNTNAVTIEDYYSGYYVTIASGSIEGITAAITITLKDNDGEEGCHVASATVTVTVEIKPNVGERVTAIPDSSEVQIYLGTIDGSLFVKKESADSSTLVATNDVTEATPFFLDDWGRIIYYSDDVYCVEYDYYEDCFTLQGSGAFFEIDNSYDGLPCALTYDCGNLYFVSYQSNANLICPLDVYNSINNPEEANPSTIFCAYLATLGNPYITPDESSLTIDGDDRTAGTNLTVASVTSLTYEILSGDSIIQSVSFSEVDNINRARVTITAKDSAFGTAVIRVKSATDDSVYTDITVRVKTDPEQIIWTLFTQTQLSYRYTKEDNNYTYTDISIRFGGRINKNTWNEINTDYHIDGFGVMITSFDPNETYRDIEMGYLSAKTPDQEFDIDNDIVNYYKSVEDMMPAEDENDYYWNLFKTIDFADINKWFAASAYIKVDGTYFYLNQVEYSVCSLAGAYINYWGCNSETAGGSLQHLYELMA